MMLRTEGDIPQNVNFAIRATVASNFLQINNVKFETGDWSKASDPTELADQAKALSVRIECR
jgi:hypothetical protein